MRHPGVERRRKRITTIEGLSADGSHPVQKAWMENRRTAVRLCQAGQIMSAARCWPKATRSRPDAQIHEAMDDNLCRFWKYLRIRDAIRRAASLSRQGT